MTGSSTRLLAGLWVASLIFLSGCSKDIPAINCETPDFDCYISHSIENINVIKENIGYWSTLHLLCQISLIVFGIVATLMIALQENSNKKWTRPIGIIATTLVTGASSVIANFHVPDNIDKLIGIATEMSSTVNEFDEKAERLKAGRTKEEIQAAYKKDKNFLDAANTLVSEFSARHNKLKMDLLRIKGTAAQLNAASAGVVANKKGK